LEQVSLSKQEKCLLKFKEVHGDRYDYSKVNYVKNNEKVTIICKKHGDFLQIPNSHKNGRGCPKCALKIRKRGACFTTEEIVNEFKEIHGDRYDYSKVEYKSYKNKVTIICKEHGEFLQSPSSHKSGQGCPKCALENKVSQEHIIEKFKEIHGDRYDYSKVEYKSYKNKVTIICKEHGEFQQTVRNHIQGNNCPKCRKYHSYYRDRNYYKGKETIFYYLYFPEYDLYKPGLTVSSVENRYIRDKGLKYEILYEEVFKDGVDAWDKEQELLDNTMEYKYFGDKILESGNTELRTKDIICYIKVKKKLKYYFSILETLSNYMKL